MRLLTGSELVSFVDDNKDMPQEEVMIQSGYFYWKRRPGTDEQYKSVEKCKFFQALSQAMGLQIGVEVPTIQPSRPKNRLKVTSNTTLPVGAPYMRALNLGEGDYVHIKVNEGKIIIEPWTEETVDDVPFDGTAEVETCSMPVAEECSLPGRNQLEITETCSFTPEQCAVG